MKLGFIHIFLKVLETGMDNRVCSKVDPGLRRVWCLQFVTILQSLSTEWLSNIHSPQLYQMNKDTKSSKKHALQIQHDYQKTATIWADIKIRSRFPKESHNLQSQGSYPHYFLNFFYGAQRKAIKIFPVIELYSRSRERSLAL